jgi:ABC transporter substrate binding protein (PQQ-dependent alcohol dehydrogenase system)
MTNRRNAAIAHLLLLALVTFMAAIVTARADTPARTIRIVLMERDEDPFYDPVRITDGVARQQNYRPFPGAELGLRDSAALGRAAGASFALDRLTLPPEADVGAEIDRVAAEGTAAILLDLPSLDMRAAAQAARRVPVPLLNIRDTDDDLRRATCGSSLFHVVPSETALTDALAQFVVRRNWRRVIVLAGPEDADTVLAHSFEASARKFGARIVETRTFAAGNDPRRREQISVPLLTGDVDFDVLFIADTLHDFGRYVPYRLTRPRPVVGTEGLQAAAWHAASERYGAPQVNSRFLRQAGRPMSELDWSAWVATRAIAEAVARRSASTGLEIVKALADGTLPIEMSKGVAGSFRPWDHQLRQPIMLHTANAVIEFAPLEGFLHPVTTLDTLGMAEPESGCTAKP